ncbi:MULTISPECIES: hypothetical protein [Stenotrophomonas]|uniref:hypothetical protein n=1 Tax=Stenotrophomonas TaxID=40323 RepID=UPI000D53D930|nr:MULTISPECIES: hypothetical protein [Stenotrophomonas]AWH21933.1 hypothetical protein C1933_12305 [Stenotrophomonas sp. ZAC14D2_NAIMI4_6]
MQARQFTRPLALLLFVPMIGLAGWGSWAATYCFSDGCLGVILLWMAALAALVVQALLVLPLHAWALKRQGLPAQVGYLRWLAASIVSVVVPVLLGWLYMLFK